ncbi:hypothetical protein CH92_21715 [Stutzerimonas stutzeri]|uniref:Uncharacterized protein n=1 Tax=Stutzerimonas stutzeri TaxID=316 RepID=W8R444_STUST|nr:hypothetical protein [Stutzerimonas stutzeri]AHL77705.1 hypothetical protein CH92_21715 [Stutzerimonas stutzeri]MCQ4330457.1 hypothetical protein [Stutzerimonas stutzeri]
MSKETIGAAANRWLGLVAPVGRIFVPKSKIVLEHALSKFGAITLQPCQQGPAVGELHLL